MTNRSSRAFRLSTSNMASLLAIPIALLLGLLLYIGTTFGWLAEARETILDKAGLSELSPTSIESLYAEDTASLQECMNGPMARLTPAPLVEPGE